MGSQSALSRWVSIYGRRSIVAALFVVPLNKGANWQVLSYRGIPTHHVEFLDEGMNIQVQGSASPIIFPLGSSKMVSKITVKGVLAGALNDFKGKKQGEKGVDDYRLRIGLVVSGERRLSFWQKIAAPKWVKTLFSLAPKKTGVDHIYFLNMAEKSGQKGEYRTHPLSDLIKEKTVWSQEGSGPFEFSQKLKEPLKVLAIWLSVDGDDTKSKYNLLLRELKLSVDEKIVVSEAN